MRHCWIHTVHSNVLEYDLSWTVFLPPRVREHGCIAGAAEAYIAVIMALWTNGGGATSCPRRIGTMYGGARPPPYATYGRPRGTISAHRILIGNSCHTSSSRGRHEKGIPRKIHFQGICLKRIKKMLLKALTVKSSISSMSTPGSLAPFKTSAATLLHSWALLPMVFGMLAWNPTTPEIKAHKIYIDATGETCP